MLQRMIEDLFYSELLSKAAQCSDPKEEAAYVAAFCNSPYASTIVRTGKPFNPLLFETFECDRRADPRFGWRVITEQVSVHVSVYLNVTSRLVDDCVPPTCTGQPPPSHVCNACGAQGLDTVGRVHCCLKVPWQVLGCLSHWWLPLGNAWEQESLHLDQGGHNHSQYHRWQTLD